MINLEAPVSSIMTSNLITVSAKDSLLAVKEIFETHNIHHIPVVQYKRLLGIVSKTDFLAVHDGLGRIQRVSHEEEAKFLSEHTAEEIMISGMAKLEPSDRINVAIHIFTLNKFHALPVVEGDDLVGMVTTHDILRSVDEFYKDGKSI
jgi:acetoin utilization protein AcuB